MTDIRLQHCNSCGRSCYPPRELCPNCLSDQLSWTSHETLLCTLLATTRLHRSNEPRFRDRLPLTIGLITIDAGSPAICFVDPGCAPGPVTLRAHQDDGRTLLTASPS